MSANDETDQGAIEGGGGAGSALRLLAIFAAGAGAALGAKALIASRRSSGGEGGDKTRGDATDEDLPTVLRRAALDVALAATSTAAERLGKSDEQPAAARRGGDEGS